MTISGASTGAVGCLPRAVTPSAEHHCEEAASQALHRGVLCLHVSSGLTAVRGCRTAGAGLKPLV